MQTDPEIADVDSLPAPRIVPDESTRSIVFPLIAAWHEPVDGAALLADLQQFFTNHVVLPPFASEILALWTLHTYAYHLRAVTTYLGVVSPQKRCGKTTLLMVLKEVAHRPLLASNISPPAIFRAIEEVQPTLLIDEADTFLQNKDEIGGILNAGYTRESAFVVRAMGEGHKLAKFSCWCPKVIASIGHLPETLADRCILITMRRKSPDEKCQRFRGLEHSVLPQKCARFVADHATEIAQAQPAIPAGLNDRAADIWEPLLALADIAGDHWPETARNAALNVSSSSEASDLTTLLLRDIDLILKFAKVEHIYSRDLTQLLAHLEERPWAEARRGGPINELWLANRLRPFGITPRLIRTADFVARGYHAEDFRDAFARYL